MNLTESIGSFIAVCVLLFLSLLSLIAVLWSFKLLLTVVGVL